MEKKVESKPKVSKNILSAPKLAEKKSEAKQVKEQKAKRDEAYKKAILTNETTARSKLKAPEKPACAYALTGELTITTSPVPPNSSEVKAWKTPEVLIDTHGSMFTKSCLEVSIDDKRTLAVLDAEQVELLLKLLRVAEYAD